MYFFLYIELERKDKMKQLELELTWKHFIGPAIIIAIITGIFATVNKLI